MHAFYTGVEPTGSSRCDHCFQFPMCCSWCVIHSLLVRGLALYNLYLFCNHGSMLDVWHMYRLRMPKECIHMWHMHTLLFRIWMSRSLTSSFRSAVSRCKHKMLVLSWYVQAIVNFFLYNRLRSSKDNSLIDIYYKISLIPMFSFCGTLGWNACIALVCGNCVVW